MTAPTRSRSAVLRIVLLDVAPLVGYYGLRACGASEYVALLTATVLSGLKVTYDAVKARRLDPFACYLLLTFGLSLAARILLSAMWGLGLLLEVAVRLVVIARVSVDVANGLLSAISLGTVGLLVVATVLIGRKLRARREQRSASQG